MSSVSFSGVHTDEFMRFPTVLINSGGKIVLLRCCLLNRILQNIFQIIRIYTVIIVYHHFMDTGKDHIEIRIQQICQPFSYPRQKYSNCSIRLPGCTQAVSPLHLSVSFAIPREIHESSLLHNLG